MKKIGVSLLVLILLAALMLSYIGCKPKVAKEAVKIEFWTTQTQSDRLSTIQLLADTFHAANPDIEVVIVPVDENDMPKQVASASAAGRMPALAEFSSDNALAFGAEGILNVDAATAIVNSVGKSEYYAGTLKLLESSAGKYFATPYHGWIQGIWYRSDWFKEAGLAPPTTWEAIEKAAKHFYQPDKNQYGILVGTKAEAYTEQCFTQFALSNKASIFDKNGSLTFNTPQMKEAVEFYAKISKYNPPGPQTWRARDYYIQGKMAGFFYSTYIMDDLALAENMAGSLTGDNFDDLTGSDFDPELANKTGFAPKIGKLQPAGFGVVVSLGFFNQDDPANTEAAQKFVEFLYTDDGYITYLHMAPGGMYPVLKKIADSEKFLNDPKGIYKRYGKAKMAEIVSGLENLMRFDVVEGNLIQAYGKVAAQQIIPQMMYKITQEGVSVDKAMSWAEGEMKKAIE